MKRWSEGAGGVAGDTIAKKNQAIDELIRELESGKAERKKMELEITDLRNEASRQKIRADKAVETAKKRSVTPEDSAANWRICARILRTA